MDDEWLWNMGDYVSVVVPYEIITYEVIIMGARDDYIFKEAASDPLPCFSACVCGIAAFCYFILCTYEW